MDEIKLKPCPFCGKEAAFFSKCCCSKAATGLTRKWEFGVGCLACGIALPNTSYSFSLQMAKDGSIRYIDDDRQEAADTWNRRADNG